MIGRQCGPPRKCTLGGNYLNSMYMYMYMYNAIMLFVCIFCITPQYTGKVNNPPWKCTPEGNHLNSMYMYMYNSCHVTHVCRIDSALPNNTQAKSAGPWEIPHYSPTDDCTWPLYILGTRKYTWCGTCTGCTREDCGSCLFCRDKKKFGGPGKKKKACTQWTCTSTTTTGICMYTLG